MFADTWEIGNVLLVPFGTKFVESGQVVEASSVDTFSIVLTLLFFGKILLSNAVQSHVFNRFPLTLC